MKTRASVQLLYLACLCLAGLCAPSVRASSGTFQAYGYVRDNLGNPIPNIDVTGDDYVGDFYTFKTDSAGYYSVDFDADGNYRITPNCAQLTARGFGCVPGISITIADGAVGVDFVVHPDPLHVASTTLPRGNVGLQYTSQLAAAGGKSPYTWHLAPDSGALPEGLTISTSGLISGKPTLNFASAIKVQVTDSAAAVTNKVLSITINPLPTLTPTLWLTNRFSMLLHGGSNQNYTVQVSPALGTSNWVSLFTTNNKTASTFAVSDPNATNIHRTYRVLIGP